VFPADVDTDRTALRVGHARVVTLVWLATTVFSSVLMPAVGVLRETSSVRAAAGVVGVLAVATTQGGVLYAAVTPVWSGERRRGWAIAFAVTSTLSLVLVAPVAAGSWPTWSWIGAAIVGTVPVVVRPVWAVAVAVLSVGVGGAVAFATGGSLVQAVIIIALIGSGIAVVNWLPVWIWGLLAAAQSGREARAVLARSEERLRFARDLHDLLGHRLTVIALKAELIERLAESDTATTRAEAEAVRRLAVAALAEAREAASGYRRVDLGAELAALQSVVEASGVRCAIRADVVSESAAAILAPVAREAVTNMLRHSVAHTCTISVEADPSTVRLTVRNDGVPTEGGEEFVLPHSGGGSGLWGMADRVRAAGGHLSWARSGSDFVVTASLSAVTDPATR
jgi:two-component system sensor histidine kinase DesK